MTIISYSFKFWSRLLIMPFFSIWLESSTNTNMYYFKCHNFVLEEFIIEKFPYFALQLCKSFHRQWLFFRIFQLWNTYLKAVKISIFLSYTIHTHRGKILDCSGILSSSLLQLVNVVKTHYWIQLWNSISPCVFLSFFLFFKKLLKDFPFFSLILLTLWFRYLQTRKKKRFMYFSRQIFLKTPNKTLNFKKIQ